MTPEEFARECGEVSRRLRRLPVTLRAALRSRVRSEVAEPMAADIRAAGSTVYGRRVAPTTRVRAGADPTIVTGSARRVVSGGGTARDLVFGIHFPAGNRITAIPAQNGVRGHRRRTTRQFSRTADPFVPVTVDRNVETYLETWADIVTETVEEETRG